MCNAYYQCAHGHRFPDQFCPDKLLFNGKVCDHPEKVTCPNESYRITGDVTTGGVTLYDDITTQANPTTTLATATSTTTTGKTAKDMTTTTMTEMTTNSKTDSTQLGTTNSCSDGIHAHPTMCNAYYHCAHGHRFPDQFCPDNLLFNGEVCDHPENVTCPKAEYKFSISITLEEPLN